MPWDRTERRSAARPASDGPRTDDVQDALSRMVEALPRFEVSHWPPTGRPSASHEVLSAWPRLGASDTEEWPWGPAPGDEPRDIQHDAGVATRSRRDLWAELSAFYAAAETFRDSSGSGPHRILGARADWVIIDEYTSIPGNTRFSPLDELVRLNMAPFVDTDTEGRYISGIFQGARHASEDGHGRTGAGAGCDSAPGPHRQENNEGISARARSNEDSAAEIGWAQLEMSYE